MTPNIFLKFSKIFIFHIFLLVACHYAGIKAEQSETRIISGSDITIDKCPYQLSLMQSNKHKCGAVVINKLWALTSAACVKGVQVKDISLRAGSTSNKNGGTIHTVAKIILHPSFQADTKDYNIALIEVTNGFDLKTAKAIALASDGAIIKPGTQTIVTGWGVLQPGATVFPEKLQQVSIPIVDKNMCVAANGKEVTDRMICGGYTTGGKDICDGDYGGPMVYQDKLYGISSWSKTCGKPGGFGLYTAISTSAIRTWIRTTAAV